MKYTTLLMTFCWILMMAPALIGQTPTPLTVRVLAHDAKWIGSSMGGVEITIRDQSNGKLLASGVTSGGTGDTDLLVHRNKSRYGKISSPGSASFEANLMLDQPVFVEIKATFRTAFSGYPIVATENRWLIPGKEMTEDGIVVELPGFAMRVNHPLPHQTVSLSKDEDVRIDLFMIMLCGCPISPGGTWDSDPMEVEAMIYQDNEFVRAVPLTNIETNRFTADLSNLGTGSYRVFVTAYDPRSKNTGVEKLQFTIRE